MIARQVKRVLSWQFKEEEELIKSLHQIKQVFLCAPKPCSLFALEFIIFSLFSFISLIVAAAVASLASLFPFWLKSEVERHSGCYFLSF